MTTLGLRLVLVQDGGYIDAVLAAPDAAGASCMPGVVTSIVDNACGYAALTRSPPGCEVVTAEFQDQPHAAAIQGASVGGCRNAGACSPMCTGEGVRLRAMGRSTNWWLMPGHHGPAYVGERLTTNRSAVQVVLQVHLYRQADLFFQPMRRGLPGVAQPASSIAAHSRCDSHTGDGRLTASTPYSVSVPADIS